MTGPSRADFQFFLPAATPEEAVERIYALTGAAHARTRGEKRAVIALRDSLGLDIPTGVTSDVMGAALAEALDVRWDAHRYVDRHKLTIDGLNALLEGAHAGFATGSLRRLEAMRPTALSGVEWSHYVPARSKIEAVNRLSALTGSGAERLGPGGKEHKRVLVNLVRGMDLDVEVTTKHGTASALAQALSTPWSDDCVSTQGTITLSGLNVLLAGAERRLGRLGKDRGHLLGTPEAEGRALAAALVEGFVPESFPDGSERVQWDGRRSVRWLAENGTGQENQMEWPGFFWEFRARTILSRRFAPNPTPPRTKYGPDPFDFSLGYVWDMKSHTEHWRDPTTGRTTPGRSGSPLNERASMDACIEEQGLGFFVVGGTAVDDVDGSFKDWHDAFKGKPAARSNSGRSRRRKTAFEPLYVDAFWFADNNSLDAAVAAGWITGFHQGLQAPTAEGTGGSRRAPKYILNASAASADSAVHLVRYYFPQKPAAGGCSTTS